MPAAGALPSLYAQSHSCVQHHRNCCHAASARLQALARRIGRPSRRREGRSCVLPRALALREHAPSGCGSRTSICLDRDSGQVSSTQAILRATPVVLLYTLGLPPTTKASAENNEGLPLRMPLALLHRIAEMHYPSNAFLASSPAMRPLWHAPPMPQPPTWKSKMLPPMQHSPVA